LQPENLEEGRCSSYCP